MSKSLIRRPWDFSTQFDAAPRQYESRQQKLITKPAPYIDSALIPSCVFSRNPTHSYANKKMIDQKQSLEHIVKCVNDLFFVGLIVPLRWMLKCLVIWKLLPLFAYSIYCISKQETLFRINILSNFNQYLRQIFRETTVIIFNSLVIALAFMLQFASWQISLVSKGSDATIILMNGDLLWTSCQLFAGGVSFIALRLAFHISTPTMLEIVSAMIVSFHFLPIWCRKSHSSFSNYTITILFIIMAYTIIILFPDAANIFRMFSTAYAVPATPLLYFFKIQTIKLEFTWTCLTFLFKQVIYCCITIYTILQCLDLYDNQVELIYYTNILKSCEQFEALLKDTSLFSNWFSLLKMSRFSANYPSSFPSNIYIQNSKKPFITNSSNIVTDKPSTIYFTTVDSNCETYNPMSNYDLSSDVNNRQNSDLAQLPLSLMSFKRTSIPKAIPPYSLSNYLKKKHQFLNLLNLSIFYSGAQVIGSSIVAATSYLFINLCPNVFLRTLLVYQPKESIAKFVFWDKQPFDTIGIDSSFYAKPSCQENNCFCKQHIYYVNGWINHTLINANDNQIWRLYCIKVVAFITCYTNSIEIFEYLFSQTNEQYNLSLQILISIENSITILKENLQDFDKLTSSSFLRNIVRIKSSKCSFNLLKQIANLVRQSNSIKQPPVSTAPKSTTITNRFTKIQESGFLINRVNHEEKSTHNSELNLKIDYSMDLVKFQYKEILQEVVSLIRLLDPLAFLILRGINNWIYVASLFDVKQKTISVIRQLSPLIYRIHLIFDRYTALLNPNFDDLSLEFIRQFIEECQNFSNTCINKYSMDLDIECLKQFEHILNNKKN